MFDWMLAKISDYWDQPGGADVRVGAIYRLSRWLVDLSDAERQGGLKEIRRAVARHVTALDDHLLVMAGKSPDQGLPRSAE